MKKSIRIPAVESIPARFASLLVAALAATAVAAGSLPAFAQAGDAAPAAEPVPVAEPAPEPEPKKAEIAKAVTCQVLISQFDENIAASKMDDAAKAEQIAALHAQFERATMHAHHVINPYTHSPVPLTQGCAQVP